MKAAVVFIVFLFFLHFANPALAVNPTINPVNVDTSTPIIGDTFNLAASMSGALSEGSYFIKCRIGANSSSLNDGQTYNPQVSQWLDDTGSTGAWIDMPQVKVGADGLWQNSIKCRIKLSSNDETKVIFVRACLNSNNSCGTSFQSTNSLTINPIFPSPTPTPTSTPVPTSTPTNTPTPTSSPTNTPTPTKTPTPTPMKTPTPTFKSDPMASSTPENTAQSSVLGESAGGELGIPSSDNNLFSDQTKKPDTVFQWTIMLLGIALIAICVIFTVRIIKKGELGQDEKE
jgi:hypothetical protein